jgi:CdiI immunity protein
MTDKFELRDRYPELFQLIAGTFNEDWFDEYPNEAAAVADYVAGFAAVYRRQALDELIELRRTAATDDDLGDALSALGSAYGPRGPGEPYRAFADRLIAWLAASLSDEPG